MLDGNGKYIYGVSDGKLAKNSQRRAEKKSGKIGDKCNCKANMKGKWIIREDGTRYYKCIRCDKLVY